MKKAYVKPEMFYENFELSHNIANCGYTGRTNYNLNDPNNCSYEYKPGNNLFYDTTAQACTVDANTVGADIYCYQTGTEDLVQVFGS